LLRDVPAGSLPTIPVPSLPGGSRVTDPAALDALALLAAAPARLLPKISQVTTIGPHGLVAQLRDGPAIYFGDTTDQAAKWVAATEVLADPGSAGAGYIDVTDPARPAAGVSASAVTAAGLATYGNSGDSSQGTAAPASEGAAGSSAAAASPTTTPSGGE
jgi:Cell division protein FtsQ